MIIKNIINALVIIFFTFFISDKSSANIKSYTCKSVNVLITLDEKFLSSLDEDEKGSLIINGEDISFVYLGEKLDFKISQIIGSDSFTGISYSRVDNEQIKQYPMLKKNKGHITNMNLIHFQNALNENYFDVDVIEIKRLRWLEVDDIRNTGVDVKTRKFICN
tara:strand:+ start:60 stop:548 length:489 start_codon:yes stop_codon:yes gene_type:complete